LLVSEQERKGWLSVESIHALARRAQATDADVAGVLSFYQDLRTSPPGKRVVRVCLGESCLANRSDRILSVLQQALQIGPGRTTPDGRFTLEQVYCAGNCAVAPTLVIGDHVHGRVAPEQTAELLREPEREPATGTPPNASPITHHPSPARVRLYLSNDTSAVAAGADRLAKAWESQPGLELIRTSSRGAMFLEPLVERDGHEGRRFWPRAAPDDLPRILAGDGGLTLDEIPFLAAQTRITFADFGLTQPLSLDDYAARGGWRGLERAGRLSPDAILDELKQSGLRGRGGAAFPVWKKWLTAKETAADRKFVVVNADEGDAGTYSDRMILEGDPYRLIEGMLICARTIGAAQGYIYCRQEYPAAARTMRDAIARAQAAGLLGTTLGPFSIELVLGAGSYVCGEETALLESLEGRRGVVRAKPPYPAVSGLYGRPTLVSNVLTFATVPSILARGGASYGAMGTARSKGTIVLQLGGRVRCPGLVEVPFGLSLEEVLERFGGGMAEGARLKAVQVGGPLGSLFPASRLDIPICYDAFADAGAILGHGGIVAFDQETDMLELARHFMAFAADESCGKCTPCRIGTVRGREILERIQAGRGGPDDLALLEDLGETMKAASLCALGGRAPYPVLTAIEYFGTEFKRRDG
jgi:formate dehydrogenase iron-sulfur subunit